MRSSSDSAFWSGFAAAYDGHIVSREANALIPRMVTHLSQRASVLDLGCGTGDLALALASSVQRVHAIDFAPGMIQVATAKAAAQGVNNVEFLVHEADELPFAEGTFDAVVMANVLHVMQDPDRALQEAARVLRPGGILVAPTYCHGQNLKTRILSRVSVLLFGIRVHNRWSSEEVLGHVGRAGLLLQSHEMVQYRFPLVFVVAAKR